jgi:hypothetical protein
MDAVKPKRRRGRWAAGVLGVVLVLAGVRWAWGGVVGAGDAGGGDDADL